MRKQLLSSSSPLACIAQTPNVARLTELSRNPRLPDSEQALKTALKLPAIQYDR
jgi:hypothetical protein